MLRTALAALVLFAATPALACGPYMPAKTIQIEDATFAVWMSEVDNTAKVGDDLFLISGRWFEGGATVHTLRNANGNLVAEWTDAAEPAQG